MKLRLIPLLLLIVTPSLAGADVARDIKRLNLREYEKAGEQVSSFLRRNLIGLSETVPDASLIERFDHAYQEKLRPGALEKLSLKPRPLGAESFIADVHRVLELRARNQTAFRKDYRARQRIQNVFIGALHVLDIEIRTELDSSIDDLIRVRRFLLSQGTFIANSGRLVSNDVWWDWLWLRGHGYASDLVELHLQKIGAISRQVGPAWQERLRHHGLSTGLYALRRNTQPVMGEEKPSVVSLRLTNTALALAGASAPVPVLKELKLYLYRGLQANGQTYEASQVKKDIAMDLFLAKGWQIVKSPAEPWSRKDLGLFSKVIASFGQLFRSVVTFVTYGAGFLFVATPIEMILVVLAVVILALQAHRYFDVQKRGFSALWTDHRLFEKDGWRRLPSFLLDGQNVLREELKLAWRMFVASYTMTGVPFFSKIAASLLLFGVGLYFNSARSLVEAVVAQMTM